MLVLYFTLYDKTDVITSFSIKEFFYAFKYWKEWIWVISLLNF